MATTRQVYWRTIDNNAVYVDSFIGDDNNPDGLTGANSRNRPYRTLGRAWRGTGAVYEGYNGDSNLTNNRHNIVCRGYFSEDMGDGCQPGSVYPIRGDYLGAAIIDCKGTKEFSHFFTENMIIINPKLYPALAFSNNTFLPTTNSEQQSAVGIGGWAGYNGASNWRTCGKGIYYGCYMFRGVVYGDWGCFVNLKHLPLVKLSYSYISGFTNKNNTLYNTKNWTADANDGISGTAGIENHVQKRIVSILGFMDRWLFARAAVILNDLGGTTFARNVFTKDCAFITLNDNGYNAIPTIIYCGDKSSINTDNITANHTVDGDVVYLTAFGQYLTAHPNDIIGALQAYCAANNYNTTFTNCRYADCSAEEIMNDPENMDYTLRPKVTINGVKVDNPAIFDDGSFAGAFGPALRIPIYGANDNKTVFYSDGHKECWDDRTAVGFITTTPNETSPGTAQGKIIYKQTSPTSSTGSILSKIVALDPLTTLISGIYSIHEPMMNGTDKISLNSEENYLDTVEYNPGDFEDATAGDELPDNANPGSNGHAMYIVKDGPVTYNGTTYAVGSIFAVTGSGTKFYKYGDGAATPHVKQVIEPNANDVVYVRCRTGIYKYIHPGDLTYSNVLYYNGGSDNLWFHGRLIVPGESFYGMDGQPVNTANSAGTGSAQIDDTEYLVAIMFDDRLSKEDDEVNGVIYERDRLVPKSDKWVPAQLLGAYFVSKNTAGGIDNASNGQPYGSGNYLSYKDNKSTTNTSIIDRVYTLFKFVANKIEV